MSRATGEVRSFAGEDAEAILDADDLRLRRSVARAKIEAQDFARQVYQATLGADPSDAARAVALANQQGSGFARQQFVASLELRGVAETLALFRAVDREADSLDGRNINLRMGTSGSSVDSLSGSFRELASNIRASRTVLTTFALPAGIAAGIPTIAALTASVAGLTSALGSGLVGAAAAAAGALGTLGGAFGLVAAPVSMLLGDLKEYDQNLETLNSSQSAAKAASQSYADSLRGVHDAQRNLAQVTTEGARAIRRQEQALTETRAEGARQITEAERTVDEARTSGAQNVRQQEHQLDELRRQNARNLESQEKALADARTAYVQNVEAAEEALEETRRTSTRAINDQERQLNDTRRSVSQANVAAERDLKSARDTLASSTRALTAAQQELNRAWMDEELRQGQATLDLSFARDRVTDATRAAAEAIATYGRGSEEATDALREQRQAELDLETTRRDVQRLRRDGSPELQAARQAEKSAREEVKKGIQAENEAEKNVQRTRAEGHRQIQGQERDLRRLRNDTKRSIREQTEALLEANREGKQQVDEQRQLLKRSNQDAARSVREQWRAISQARRDATTDEEEQLRQLAQVRRDVDKQERDAIRALNDTRRSATQQENQAQRQLTEQMRTMRRAAQDLKQSQREVRGETEKLTPAQKTLYDEYQRFQRRADKFFRPAQNASARLGVEILKLAGDYLPRLGDASRRTVGSLADAFDNFRGELAKPITQSGIDRFLREIPISTRTAANAAGDLGLALFNVFTKTLPYQRKLLRGTEDLMSRFLRFTQSAEGQNKLERWFAAGWKRAKQLKNVFVDLGIGVGNVFDEVNEAGLDDQAVRGLQTIAGGLREITAEGSEGRKTLDRFLTNSKGLMKIVGSTALTLAGQVGRVASEVVGFREKGSRLTVLQGIFRGIKRSAKPMADTLINLFEDIGPAIRDMMPPLSRFVRTFGEAAGETTKTFLNMLTRMFRAFNNLPDPLRRTAARLAAVSLALKFTGLGALIGSLGKLSGKFFGLNRSTKGLAGKAGLGAVAGGLASIGRLLGPGIGIAALAGAFLLAYRNNKKFREGVDETVQKLRALGENKFRQAKSAFRDIFDIPTGVVKKAGTKAGDATVSAYQQAVRRGTRHSGEGKWYEELGTRIGQTIASGLNKWARSEGKSILGPLGRQLTKQETIVEIAAKFNRRLAKEIKTGTDWKGVGERITELLGNGATNPAAKEKILKLWRGVKKSIGALGWEGLGRALVREIVRGFTGVDLGGQLKKKTGKAAEQAKSKRAFEESGKASAGGYLSGFTSANIARGVIAKLKDTKDWVARWQKEGSPARLWMPHGVRAALGWAKGFERGGKDMLRSVQNQFLKMEANLTRRTRRAERRVLRNSERTSREINASYDSVLERAQDRGATPKQVASIERARAKAILENQRNAEFQLRDIRKRHAEQEHRLREQRVKDLQKAQDRFDKQRVQREHRTRKRHEQDRHRDRERLDRRRIRLTERSVAQRVGGADSPRERQALLLQQARLAEMSGREGRARRLIDASRRTALEHKRATSPQSPGGKHITAREMRQIMKENSREQMRAMRAAAAVTVGLPQFRQFLDAAMGAGLDHHTDMKADAV